MRSIVLALAKHRLVHFLALGALIAAFAPRARSVRVIVIDDARVFEAVRASEARTGRPLTSDEKAALVQALVDEEVLAREAVRTGLATDDAVVRARLAAAMRASVARAVPSTARPAPRLRVAVWYAQTEGAAEAIAKAIRERGTDAARGGGERPPIPDGAVWTEADLAEVAGVPAAEAAFATELGKPTGAIASAWGFYVLVPLERLAPAAATAPVSDDVDRWLKRARRDYAIEVSPGFARSNGRPRVD